jgi:hypothetical protein
MMERSLERGHYRSTAEVLDRYGWPPHELERWRDRAEPPFPAPVEVRWQEDVFFHILRLVAWEMSILARTPRPCRRCEAAQ